MMGRALVSLDAWPTRAVVSTGRRVGGAVLRLGWLLVKVKGGMTCDSV